MILSQWLVLIIGLLLIAFTAWWFFGKRHSVSQVADQVGSGQIGTITVAGGYSPDTLVFKRGVPATVKFNLRDSTACLSEVSFSQLGIKEKLNRQAQTEISIPTDKAAEFNFACGMNMFHGKVIVK
ncbi:MAG: cupredoxin domain-containing protein [Lactobacillus sp.]|nr:cupredoxin domain-containing protein [Lactobacillus sp.]MDN6052634.1 cupredoxin domain-containing protein [Lactobacillus sp.]